MSFCLLVTILLSEFSSRNFIYIEHISIITDMIDHLHFINTPHTYYLLTTLITLLVCTYALLIVKS